ncbi:MAG: hypothetical protein RIT81_08835 [Deltaproteobacteria bacterium]
MTFALVALAALAGQTATPVVPPAPEAERDAFRYAKYAALIDGVWSGAMTVAWSLSANSHRTPQPEGAIGIVLARVLYGTTWTVQVALNTALLRFALGEDFDGLEKGSLRNNWLVGLDIPAPCERGGGDTCGLGLGGYSEITVKLRSGLELTMTGGWIQGRFDTDERRTLMESTWIQAPLIVRTRHRAELGPVAFEAVFGGGLYYGMHNAHVHERPAFRGDLDVPPWELIVLHAGAGVGAHAKVAVDLFDVITVEGEADLAPFLINVRPRPPDVVAPLAADRTGLPVWRRASVGVGLADGILPVRLSVRYYGLELGPRPTDGFGHRGLIFQFETPFELEDDEDDPSK